MSQAINPRPLRGFPLQEPPDVWEERPRKSLILQNSTWNLHGATALTAPLESGFREINPSSNYPLFNEEGRERRQPPPFLSLTPAERSPASALGLPGGTGGPLLAPPDV